MPARARKNSRSKISFDDTDQWRIPVSDRLLRLPPYLFGKLNALKLQLRQQGKDIIDLGMGNPTDPTPKLVVDKLCDAVQDRRNHRYSAMAAGVVNLRKEVAKHYQRKWNVELDPEKEIIATIGSKEGFSHLCLALLGAGDTVIVPSPAFPVHLYGVSLAGANAISIPIYDQEYFLKQLVETIENLYPRPKMIVLNFPHNPTTSCVELAFFEEVVRIARRFKLLVIQDLAYGETTFDEYQAPSLLQARGALKLGVEFTTMSKAFNMAGWRIGYCSGSREIIRALEKIKGYFDYGIFQPVQIASIIALRHCQDFVDEQAMQYQKRRDILCKGLNRNGWEVTPPKATMFVWAPIPAPFRDKGSIEFSIQLMKEAEVAASPGRAFGELGEGYLRFALVENQQRLSQAVRQIGRLTRQQTTSDSKRNR